ncbi:hypothetical protein LCGC14_2458370 [marine sediment metagenome]|uniref:Uncharacterized protein n=1 Tax=marine sediment metagenome TaxID=412755 RepID=A0A0F9BDY2_9ZZZZ
MKKCSKCKKKLPLKEFHKDVQRKTGLRSRCKKCVSEYQAEYHKKYYSKIRETRKSWPSRRPEVAKAKRQALKTALINYYGNGECACCGEKEITFLTIDHIEGGGCKHLKKIGYNFYKWLKQNNYPKGYQVLCFNCNRGKHLNNGVCPHKDNSSPAGERR